MSEGRGNSNRFRSHISIPGRNVLYACVVLGLRDGAGNGEGGEGGR